MFNFLRMAGSRLMALFSRRRIDADFGEELETHLELLTSENLRRGMSLKQAEREARIRLGGMTQLRQTHREMRGLPFVDVLAQDLRFALRMLRNNPGFAAVAILTLALGIGANTAIFSVVYAVLLKPLPYPHSEQLFNVFEQMEKDASAQTGWSYPNFAELREQNHIFTDVAGSQHHELTLTGRGEPSTVSASVVTPEFFSVFQVSPLAGRVLSSEDGRPASPAVVVMSEGMWRGVFGSDPNIIGSSINLDKRPFTVIGVVPASFGFPAILDKQQVWIPIRHDPLFSAWIARRGGHWLTVTGRLKPGISKAEAQSELDALAGRLAREFPAENAGWLVRMIPLRKMLVEGVASPLLLLLAAVGLVLLIACANIANLLLARATSRAREMAMRAALGAGRARIVRQLLSETALLGLLGGLAGILLAWWGVQALTSFLPATLPQVNEIRVERLVLLFALLLSGLSSCLFGLAPAWFLTRSDLESSLRGDGRSGESVQGIRARSILASSEVALAMVLLVTAGLLVRSLGRLTTVDPGFAVRHILKTDVSLPQFQYSTPQQWSAFADELLTRLAAEPGLRDSAFAVPLPIADNFVNLGFEIVGTPSSSQAESRTANYVSATPGYFRLMSIPLLSGRTFDRRDAGSARKVCVVSEALRRMYFPNQDPVGQRLMFAFPPASPQPREIIGVVGDVLDRGLGTGPAPMMYVPYAQAPFWGGNIVIRTNLEPPAAAAAIRRRVAELDKDLPVSGVVKLEDLVDSSVAQPRFRTYLLELFATLAVLLAATGIYGVISYSVARRTREIGIRVALGASRAGVLKLVVGESLLLTFAGLALGVPGALLAGRLLKNMLFRVSPADPITLVAVAAVLLAVAFFASYVPVRRAMRVNPTEALRHV
jgi:putative ABC transport system permease protein